MVCVRELQTILRITRPSVSKHLKILEDAGLVDFKKDGLWVYYFDDGRYSVYAASLLENIKHWLNHDR